MKQALKKISKPVIRGTLRVLLLAGLVVGLTGCYTQLATVEKETKPTAQHKQEQQGETVYYDESIYEYYNDPAASAARKVYEDRYYGRISQYEYWSRMHDLKFIYADPFFEYGVSWSYDPFGFDPMWASYIPRGRFGYMFRWYDFHGPFFYQPGFHLSFSFGFPHYRRPFYRHRYGFNTYHPGYYSGYYGSSYYNYGTSRIARARNYQPRRGTVGRSSESRGRTISPRDEGAERRATVGRSTTGRSSDVTNNRGRVGRSSDANRGRVGRSAERSTDRGSRGRVGRATTGRSGRSTGRSSGTSRTTTRQSVDRDQVNRRSTTTRSSSRSGQVERRSERVNARSSNRGTNRTQSRGTRTRSESSTRSESNARRSSEETRRRVAPDEGDANRRIRSMRTDQIREVEDRTKAKVLRDVMQSRRSMHMFREEAQRIERELPKRYQRALRDIRSRTIERSRSRNVRSKSRNVRSRSSSSDRNVRSRSSSSDRKVRSRSSSGSRSRSVERSSNNRSSSRGSNRRSSRSSSRGGSDRGN